MSQQAGLLELQVPASIVPICFIPLPCSCAVCIFPAVGDIVSFVFSVLYLFLFWRTTRRMSATIINKHMHLRLRVFQFSAMSGELEGSVCWGTVAHALLNSLSGELPRQPDSWGASTYALAMQLNTMEASVSGLAYRRPGLLPPCSDWAIVPAWSC